MTSPRALNGTKRRGSSFFLSLGATECSGRSLLRGGGGEVSLDIAGEIREKEGGKKRIEAIT